PDFPRCSGGIDRPGPRTLCEHRPRVGRCRDRMEEISALYHALLDAWNRHDAAVYAALFADDGYVVGFDGSEMKGRHEIERSLGAIFADHETGRYVGKVRAVRSVAGDVAL